MALYTLDNPDHLPQVAPLLTREDALLLLGAATTLLFTNREQLQKSHATIKALNDDMMVLGLQLDQETGEFSASYKDWVDLALEHQQHVHWR
ncbi:MAG: DsrH/TusB family sulfur metabolism protein [Halieaceae bacterium]|jgi:sulfur relay protein TusB/DsrH|nr:DsrH/TusB family sulfur metabolism protein [Halieaceae bacterium]